jgi:hypothetical protein
MRTPLLALAALLALTACSPKPQEPSAPVVAEEAPAEAGPGQTEAEMVERTLLRWSTLDANGDGSLTQAEIKAGARGDDLSRSARVGGLLTHADGNGDGAVSKAEAESYAHARFLRQDTNKDGAVSDAEFQAPLS